MSYLSPTELARVWALRPDVLSTLTRHMAEFEKRTGRRTTVPKDGGVRTFQRQGQIYADSTDASGAFKPQSRAAPAGSSAHELGAAYDLQIVGGSGFTDPGYAVLAQIGEELGMVAGLHFKNGPPDPFHFETAETQQVRQRLWADVVRGRLQRALIAGAAVTALGLCVWLGWRSITQNARADD